MTIPDDWKTYKWSDNCVVRHAAKGSTLPPPVTWQPCLPGAPEGIGCRVWQEDNYKVGPPLSFARNFMRLKDGRWVTQVHRVAKDGPYSVAMVIDTAGVPLTAVSSQEVGNEMCTSGDDVALADGKWAVGLGEGPHLNPGWTYNGGVGGDIADGEVAMSYRRKNQANPNGVGGIDAASAAGIVHSVDELLLYDWAGSAPVHFYSGKDDPNGLPGYDIVSVEGVSFIQVNSGGMSGIDKWQAGKVTPFLRAPNDYDKGFGDFGTDGVDMVWKYGEGLIPGSPYVFKKQDLMTAPYTTDAATASKTAKRLRSYADGMSPEGWRVGCGYAALSEATETDVWLRVVRLSDGVGWKVRGTVFPYAISAIGLTCDHVVVSDPAARLMRFDLAAIVTLPSDSPD